MGTSLLHPPKDKIVAYTIWREDGHSSYGRLLLRQQSRDPGRGVQGRLLDFMTAGQLVPPCFGPDLDSGFLGEPKTATLSWATVANSVGFKVVAVSQLEGECVEVYNSEMPSLVTEKAGENGGNNKCSDTRNSTPLRLYGSFATRL